jgi:hypothetical protein
MASIFKNIDPELHSAIKDYYQAKMEYEHAPNPKEQKIEEITQNLIEYKNKTKDMSDDEIRKYARKIVEKT